jgi:hypothetical protein
MMTSTFDCGLFIPVSYQLPECIVVGPWTADKDDPLLKT